MDRRQRRHLARRPVARHAARFHPFVLAAWLLAALLCGVGLWLDAHFVMTYRSPSVEGTTTFRRFEMTSEVRIVDQDPISAYIEPEPRTETYAELRARIRDRSPDAQRGRVIFARLARAGSVLLVLACAAPLLGLLAFAWRGGSPAFRHVLLLLAALAPLAAMEYFGVAVDALYEQASTRGLLAMKIDLHVAPATWWARLAWGGLAGAAAVSWRRWPKPHRATPVDPEVFA